MTLWSLEGVLSPVRESESQAAAAAAPTRSPTVVRPGRRLPVTVQGLSRRALGIMIWSRSRAIIVSRQQAVTGRDREECVCPTTRTHRSAEYASSVNHDEQGLGVAPAVLRAAFSAVR